MDVYLVLTAVCIGVCILIFVYDFVTNTEQVVYERPKVIIENDLFDYKEAYCQLVMEVWCCPEEELEEDEHISEEGHKDTLEEIGMCNVALVEAYKLKKLLADSDRSNYETSGQ